MDRNQAIKYLNRKGKISAEHNEADEKEIAKVVKKGKIYGDPLVELD